MDDTTQPTGGEDSRDGGQGRTDIPEETVSSEDDLSLSAQVAEREEQGE